MQTPPPYTKTEELRELSFQYIIDAYHFHTQGLVLLEDKSLEQHCQYHIGYLSKIAVLFYMSMECSLKSLVCASDINLDPHLVYHNKIKKSGHSISKLIQNVSNFSNLLSDKKIEAELLKHQNVNVSERYSLEVTSEQEVIKESSIANYIANKKGEIQTLQDLASRLSKRAWEIRAKQFNGHRTLAPGCVKVALQKIIKERVSPGKGQS